MSSSQMNRGETWKAAYYFWLGRPRPPPLLPYLIPPSASSRLVALSLLPPRAALPLLPDSARSQSGEGPADSALAQRLLSRLTHFRHHPTSAVRATAGYSPCYSTLQTEPLRYSSLCSLSRFQTEGANGKEKR
ncbi:hypothetical protein K438DRAFT_1998817 [Mycena galopus ATCC 62051]|nr:hypothetical protein K438DRAFT_1998817 [Mycena galopus ATCC 62051]